MRRPPIVSDHALVRFLQRAGLDVEAVRVELANSLAAAHGAAVALDAGDHLVVADGLTFVLRDGVVVTAVEARTPGQRASLLAGDWRP